MTPAAQAFWLTAIRPGLSLGAGLLIRHGFATQSGATAYTEELAGAILAVSVQCWANRMVYWQQIRAVVGRAMPAGATHDQVLDKVDQLKEMNALPSVFTAPNVTASLVKP